MIKFRTIAAALTPMICIATEDIATFENNSRASMIDRVSNTDTYLSTPDSAKGFSQKKLDGSNVCPSSTNLIETQEALITVDQSSAERDKIDVIEYSKVIQEALNEASSAMNVGGAPLLVCIVVGDKVGTRISGQDVLVISTTKDINPLGVYRHIVNGIIDIYQERSRNGGNQLFTTEVHDIIDQMQSSSSKDKILPLGDDYANKAVFNLLKQMNNEEVGELGEEKTKSDRIKAMNGIKIALEEYELEVARREARQGELLSNYCYDSPEDCVGHERAFYEKIIKYMEDEFGINIDTIIKMAEIGGNRG